MSLLLVKGLLSALQQWYKEIDNNIRITIIERAVDVFMDGIGDDNGRLYIEHSLLPYVTSS